jgi:ribosomal protein S19E (S16A)
VEYLEYEESPIDLDWVKTQIEKDKKGEDWYYARLFEIYIQQGCSVTNTSKLTSIPINSTSRDINKYRKHLNRIRQQILK